ncbi:hypothetical protein PGQ11_007695 [Apiospora arundinis]|uniref:Uncharacterized protein n=1 Tax=Apiospora arundinis TaxID=335852 RepID=A0ABR2IWA1_9PEZI
MSAHCNVFLDDSESEGDDIGTNSRCSSDVPDSPGSLKDFIDDSASNESSFAISEQPSPSTDDEGESSTSRSLPEERSSSDVGHLYRLLPNLHKALVLLQKSMGVVEELVLQQTASPILAEDKSR